MKFRIVQFGPRSPEFDDVVDARAYIAAHPEIFPRGKIVEVVGPSNGDPKEPDTFSITPRG